MGILSTLGGPRPASTPVGAATQITTTELPTEFKPFITDIFEKAKAQQQGLEYTPYPGARLAPFGPLQEEAFEGLTGLARQGIAGAPDTSSAFYAQEALEAARRAGRPIETADIERLTNPYQQQVTDIAKREAERAYERNVAPQIEQQAVAAGSYGGSRAAMLESTSLDNLQRQLSDIQMKGSFDAYQQAQKAYEQEAGRAAGLRGFMQQQMQGVPAQALTELGTLQSVGETQQLLDQKALNLGYEDFLSEREFPTRALQEYQATVRGFPYTPAAYQYTQQTAPTPSLGQTLLTAGAQGLGMYGTLGGFGFGGMGNVQKTASGGQIRGGLSGLVESHQNNEQEDPIRRQESAILRGVPGYRFSKGLEKEDYRQRALKGELERRSKRAEEMISQGVSEYKQPEYTGLHPAGYNPEPWELEITQTLSPTGMQPVSLVESLLTPSRGTPAGAGVRKVPKAESGQFLEDLYRENEYGFALPIQGPPHIVPDPEKVAEGETGERYNILDVLIGRAAGTRTPAQSLADMQAAHRKGIRLTKQGQTSARDAEALELQAEKAARDAQLQALAKKSTITAAQLARQIGEREKSTREYDIDLQQLEQLQQEEKDIDTAALAEQEEGAELAQQMYEDERKSLRRQRGFEIAAAFGQVGEISREEAALGQAAPGQGLITTLGRIASQATKAMAPNLRQLSEKDRASTIKSVERKLSDQKEYRNLQRAAKVRDKEFFKTIHTFEKNYEKDLSEYFDAEDALKLAQALEPADRAKAEIAVFAAGTKHAMNEAARQAVLAGLQRDMTEASGKAERDSAKNWIDLWKAIYDAGGKGGHDLKSSDYAELRQQIIQRNSARIGTDDEGKIIKIDGKPFGSKEEALHNNAQQFSIEVYQKTGDLPLALKAYDQRAESLRLFSPVGQTGGTAARDQAFRNIVKAESGSKEAHIDNFMEQTGMSREEAVRILDG